MRGEENDDKKNYKLWIYLQRELTNSSYCPQAMWRSETHLEMFSVVWGFLRIQEVFSDSSPQVYRIEWPVAAEWSKLLREWTELNFYKAVSYGPELNLVEKKKKKHRFSSRETVHGVDSQKLQSERASLKSLIGRNLIFLREIQEEMISNHGYWKKSENTFW